MKLQERNIRKETEKALFVAIALKSSEYKVTVINQPRQKEETFDFGTFQKAYAYFAEKCDSQNVDFEPFSEEDVKKNEITAGGIGYDFEIKMSYNNEN